VLFQATQGKNTAAQIVACNNDVYLFIIRPITCNNLRNRYLYFATEAAPQTNTREKKNTHTPTTTDITTDEYKNSKNILEIWGRAQREAARRRKSNCRDNFGWFKFHGQQRHLANQSEKLSEIAPKFHLGGST